MLAHCQEAKLLLPAAEGTGEGFGAQTPDLRRIPNLSVCVNLGKLLNFCLLAFSLVKPPMAPRGTAMNQADSSQHDARHDVGAVNLVHNGVGRGGCRPLRALVLHSMTEGGEEALNASLNLCLLHRGLWVRKLLPLPGDAGASPLGSSRPSGATLIRRDLGQPCTSQPRPSLRGPVAAALLAWLPPCCETLVRLQRTFPSLALCHCSGQTCDFRLVQEEAEHAQIKWGLSREWSFSEALSLTP